MELLDIDEPIRGEVRQVGYRRVSHGLYLRILVGLTAAQEFRRDLKAWLLVLPDGAVFTHLTAARLYGWRLPKLPEQVPVFAAVEGDPPRPRRTGLICSRLVRPTRGRTIHGLPVDEPEEVLLRAARDLAVLDLAILIDSARALGHLDPARMCELLASGRPGTRRLRAAWDLSTRLSESAGETVLHVFHRVMDIPVQPQVTLVDDHGRIVGRADLLLTGTNHVHEYDGAVHRDPAQHRRDLRRERGWRGTLYTRAGFTLDDLLNHPLVVMHELDRLLGRPHRMSRLRRWQRMVDESLYSESGRCRVMNRWKRVIGVIDW